MTSDDTLTTGARPGAATAVGWLAVIGTLGALIMAVAHYGVDIPVLGELIGVGTFIPPAAIAFTVGTVLYLVVAYGAFRVARWAWLLGIVVNALAFLSAAFPFRGWVSGVAMAVSFVSVVVLVSPAGRRAFRG